MAKEVQKTLSKTSMLASFLPTGTLTLCTPVKTLMILVLLCLCCASCFFFHFTDSFKGPDGKVYYGFVSPRGLSVFKSDLGVETPKDERYKLGFSDFVHALMSVMVFLSIVSSDHRVTNCLLKHHVKEKDEVMESFPLMVGIICSALYLVFPTTRYGLGCMAA
ncbi:hypothetical protein MKX01_027583 [Papaver californicum]|nr:hypothetical protein MKX01_027583 [Papaver californicum]